jgi:hypothetical protein
MLLAIGGKYAMEKCQVDSRLWHQGRQPGDEIQRLKDDVGHAISVWRLQFVSNVAIRGERQAFFRYRRPTNVPAQPLKLFALICTRRYVVKIQPPYRWRLSTAPWLAGPHLSPASRMLADFAAARAPGWSEIGSLSYHLSEDQAGAREKP